MINRRAAKFFKFICVYWLCLWLVMPVSARNILAIGHNTSSAANQRPGTSPQYIGRLSNAANPSKLAAATQSVITAQGLQQAAHAAALGMKSNILNGLSYNSGGNGLVPSTYFVDKNGNKVLSNGTPFDPTMWVNADQPVQTVANGVTTVDIKQTQKQAVLFWQSFNISKDTILNFDQSLGGNNVGNWVAINEINNSTSPSQIYGKINAQGSVYIINQNGIIFHGSSQINAHTLVASALAINDTLVAKGFLNNSQTGAFLFNSTDNFNSGSPGVGSTTLPAPNPSNLAYTVSVEQGATLNSTKIDLTGGKIALIGDKVTNNGTLSANNGQIILAAGSQVAWNAHPSTDPSLRGVDVYVGQLSDSIAGEGVAENNGSIISNQGDVVMVGQTINQNGLISSTTSVNFNGRIDLLAAYNATEAVISGSTSNITTAVVSSNSTGEVNFGSNSITQILPDTSSLDRIAGPLSLTSVINVVGGNITLGTNASIFAPGAKENNNEIIQQLSDGSGRTFFAASAGVNLQAGEIINGGFYNSNGNITLESGATIDVSGLSDINASVLENIVAVQVRGPQLANSPLQRDGILRGQTIYLDLSKVVPYNGQYYYGTALADFSGYYAAITRTVDELSINGGTVALTAGTKVNLEPGSQVNVSGGWINYQGSIAPVTYVLENGHWIDISQALPNVSYSGLNQGAYSVVHPHWGVTSSYFNPLGPLNLGNYNGVFNNTGFAGINTISGIMDQFDYVPGYYYGGNGGKITITAPQVALNGNLQGNTVTGALQRVNAPAASTLDLELYGYTFNSTLSKEVESDYLNEISPGTSYGLTGGTIEIGNAQTLPTGNGSLFLSSDLVNVDGFGHLILCSGVDGGLNLNGDDNIVLDAGTTLNLGSAGSVDWSGANISIYGNIIAPGGHVNLAAYDYSPTDYSFGLTQATDQAGNLYYAPQPYTALRGKVEVAGNLSTAGLAIDDSFTSPTFNTLPLTVSKGSYLLGSAAYDNGLSTLNGGTVTLAAYSIHLDSGSSIDVSGGVHLTNTFTTAYGSGGLITLAPYFSSGTGLAGIPLTLPKQLPDYLTLQGSLSGYGGLGQAGGSLSLLNLYQVTIGEGLVSSSLFNEGGFSTFNIDSYESDNLTLNSIISPQVLSNYATYTNNQLELMPMEPILSQRSPISLNFNAQTFPSAGLDINGDFASNAPASVPIKVPASTLIQLDPNPTSQVSIGSPYQLISNTRVNYGILSGTTYGVADTIDLEGQIRVPGGTIKVLSGGFSGAVATLTLGSSSLLSTAGASVPTPNAQGYYTGSVLDGGTISLTGNILAQAGAQVDVQGSSDTFYVDPSMAGLGNILFPGLNQARLVPLTEYSNGGTVNITGKNFVLWQGTINGNSGGGSAAQGTLTITCSYLLPNLSSTGTANTYDLLPNTPNITIESNPSQIPSLHDLYLASSNPDAMQNYNIYNYGGAYFSAATLNNSQMGEIDLNGTVPPSGGYNINGNPAYITSTTGITGAVEFKGNVALQVSRVLKIASGGFIEEVPEAGQNSLDQVILTAPYVALGSPIVAPLPVASQTGVTSIYTNGISPIYVTPTTGPAHLTVNASLIDVGNLSLAGFSETTFYSSGDIRGSGTLDAAGTLNLAARQIYVPTLDTFNINAYSDTTNGGVGVVNITSTGPRENLPLSAGGNVNVYASTINQNGILLAPFGSITLGWNGVGNVPGDLLSGSFYNGQPVGTPGTIEATKHLNLGAQSVTSVSGIDPLTGVGITVPYGFTINGGTQWIDPTGTDITNIGVPHKNINLSGLNITQERGSVLDLRGGGDLYAYRFVSGLFGTNDILDSGNPSTQYAILPGNQSGYAQIGNYNTNTNIPNTITNPTTYPANNYTDQGYAPNSTTQVGDQVYLPATNGLPAGFYTLLPTRYATLPGAYLITLEPGVSIGGTLANADGSSLVSGYIINGLNGTRRSQGYSTFEVDPGSVVQNKVQYDLYDGTSFFSQVARTNQTAIPLSTQDAGHLIITVQNSISLQGTGLFGAAQGKIGIADITSDGNDIFITDGTQTVQSGDNLTNYITLKAPDLTGLNAGSLLIGGTRQVESNEDIVTVNASNIVLNNPGSSLEGSDVILTALQTIQLDKGSLITATGSVMSPQLNLNGNGVLLRVSSDPLAQISRSNYAATVSGPPPTLNIGAGSRLQGNNLILDTTGYTQLDPAASLTSNHITFDANQIIIDQTGAPVTGITNIPVTFSINQLHELTSNLDLNLISNTSIDFYGEVNLGNSVLINDLILNSAEIRGYNTGSGPQNVTLNANNIFINNENGGTGLGIDPNAISENNFNLNASHVYLGATPQNLSVGVSAYNNGSGSYGVEGIDPNDPNILYVSSNVDLTKILTQGTQIQGQGILPNTYVTAITLVTTDSQGNPPHDSQGNPFQDNQGNALADVYAITLNQLTKTADEAFNLINTTSIQYAGTVGLDQFNHITVTAQKGLAFQGSGNYSTAANVTIHAPVVITSKNAVQSFTTTGNLIVDNQSGGSSDLTPGLNGQLSLTASSISDSTLVDLPSGKISLTATGGDLHLGSQAQFSVAGTNYSINDYMVYSNSGSISLTSTTGNVVLDQGSFLDLSAPIYPGDSSIGGNGGTLSINAANTITLNGTLKGQGVNGGSVSLVEGNTAGTDVLLGSYDNILNTAGFTSSRSYEIGSGNVVVNGLALANKYTVTADGGNVEVSPSGHVISNSFEGANSTGGTIQLIASGNVVLDSGAILDVSGRAFGHNGKGGEVDLFAGSEVNGVGNPNAYVDISTGSTIDLSVGAKNKSAATIADEQYHGDFEGVLHLRQEQDSNGILNLQPINGTILGGSYIVMEGYKTYDYNYENTNNGYDLYGIVSAYFLNDGNNFLNQNSVTSLLGSSVNFTAPLYLAPGFEVVNTSGDIVLNNASVNGQVGVDFSTYRFTGSNPDAYVNGSPTTIVGNVEALPAGDTNPVVPGVPGYFTLRAQGNLVLQGSISDGFTGNPGGLAAAFGYGNTGADFSAYYESTNPELMPNFQTFSYNFTAGANFNSANTASVLSNQQNGSLMLGVNGYDNFFLVNGTYFNSLGQYLSQLIRTGSGDITINAAKNIDLMNSVATIYTAGTPSNIANFDLPFSQQTFGGQLTTSYGYAGGNVSLNAGMDIEHTTMVNYANSSGVDTTSIMDVANQLPMDWLYRRGETNNNGTWFVAQNQNLGTQEVETTSWWVETYEFFEGIGALGGGNVTMVAGHDISNVDAVVPTNLRTIYQTADQINYITSGTLELGGGDLRVVVGNDINGGNYYVERGQGTLQAGGSIVTNYLRDTTWLKNDTNATSNSGNYSELGAEIVSIDAHGSGLDLNPTLFLGKGNFDLEAAGSIVVGPTLNVFLQPEAVANLNNPVFTNLTGTYESYFSTYSPDSAVKLQALTGDIAVQTSIGNSPAILYLYNQNELYNLDGGLGQFLNGNTMAFAGGFGNGQALSYQVESLFPGSLTLISGQNINLIAQSNLAGIQGVAFGGQINLAPSSHGTLDLIASRNINALLYDNVYDASATNTYGTNINGALINISDCAPNQIPSLLIPLNSLTAEAVLDSNFSVTAATNSPFQTQNALHDVSLLHQNDPNTAKVYAGGDISGLNLYSSLVTRVIAGNNITDVGLYLQNNRVSDVSLVQAGNDILLYDPNTPLRQSAQQTVLEANLIDVEIANNSAPDGGLIIVNNNIPIFAGIVNVEAAAPNSGDIQISGPGSLEVLAGRNLTLGSVAPNGDGTGVGITAVGNQVNPFLGGQGANLIVASGLGAEMLNASNFNAFENTYLNPATAGSNAVTYDADLSQLTDFQNLPSGTSVWNYFQNNLNQNQQQLDALDIFYLVLRDAGRAHTSGVVDSGYGPGYTAIAELFRQPGASGDINLVQREINSLAGGEVDVLAPSGSVEVGLDVSDQPQEQGIFTEAGGNINIFAQNDVTLGSSRVFTLRGGNITIWSSLGNIAAGSASKTVQAAPPNRVVIDPYSANVTTDLGGVATGGGIGVLASIPGVPTGNVALVAPVGTVDAGDAGIRATGNVTIAALQVLNADNIAAGGTISGAAKTTAVTVTPSSSSLNPSANSSLLKTVDNNEITVQTTGYGMDPNAGEATPDTTPPPASSNSNPNSPDQSTAVVPPPTPSSNSNPPPPKPQSSSETLPPTTLTPTSFDRIKVGMSDEQVEAILGAPDDATGEDGHITLVYTKGKSVMTLIFMNHHLKDIRR